MVVNVSEMTDHDIYLFHEGTDYLSYQMLGAHLTELNGIRGVRFAVWAPNAKQISVVGDFNSWDSESNMMSYVENSTGLWSIFIPNVKEGDIYKYLIETHSGEMLYKSDPYAFSSELRPLSASKVANLNKYVWNDDEWRTKKTPVYEKPMNIYEIHLGSWKFNDKREALTYRELAEQLPQYVKEMGYTHIELMPIVEYPFDGSWGYQATGYYSVTSRYGSCEDFMYFIDKCHQADIGIILDWVPGHFCKDAHGLAKFDGSPLYEYGESWRAENYEWGTLNFDLGRCEVISFLTSNAHFWFDVYHIDGIRIDAVANMLYLNYAREDNWATNIHGGTENLEAISFLRRLNETIFKTFPEALVIAEDSTAWPLVTHPTYLGGLGFNFKWNMGWMNDMLEYMELEPINRKFHHKLITFSFMYAFSENYVLPLSHDEVVHGKRSLLDKMPGDYWQKFANLRAFYGYMMAHPGKKLLFMGGEFGQFIEWNYKDSLDWHLLEYDMHGKLHNYVKELNHFYLDSKPFWCYDHDWQGFNWIDCQDYSQSVIVFLRKGKEPKDFIIVICNFTPVVRENYRIGVPFAEYYEEAFNSDDVKYGGSGQTNGDKIIVESIPFHHQENSVSLVLPPLATIYLKPQLPLDEYDEESSSEEGIKVYKLKKGVKDTDALDEEESRDIDSAKTEEVAKKFKNIKMNLALHDLL
ncbi:1,4-alpha-glucan branching protein GlgB [Selenomonadales bacterium OttesenSCG-928-I06]|nr:1,4-alpha-glucan branching protein GlgB [Selenomonadales bacterium OttesenSCG-928-I06]